MSKKINPLFVGSFVVLATFLFISLLVVFSSSTLFTPTVRFYVFFDTSLNGLDVGASVKFKGVPIGSVEAVNIIYDNDLDKACASVLLKIDATSLRMAKKKHALGVDYHEFYAEQISRGLAAKLSLESIVTGKSYVALDYYPHDSERYFKDIDGLKYQQMPSMMTDFDEFIYNVDTVVRNISAVDFGEVGENLNAVLIKCRRALDSLDLKRMGAAFSEACESIGEVLREGRAKEILRGIEVAVAKFNLKFDSVADEVSGAFSGMRSMLDENSPFRRALEDNLTQFERMLRSLREFLDFLERNPNAIFAGKEL